MSTGFILQSTKNPDKVFEVIKYDADTKIGILRGALGTEFPHDMSKEHLVKYGYKVVAAAQRIAPANVHKPAPDEE